MFVLRKLPTSVALTLLLLLNAAVVHSAPVRDDARLLHKIAVPEEFLVTQDGRTFGGDVRIGDMDGNGRCDFLVYRCADGANKGAHAGGMKPCFLVPPSFQA